MSYVPLGWAFQFWPFRRVRREVHANHRLLLCGKRRWYIRKGVDMRWPPPLTPNNTVRITDASFQRATLSPPRFAAFTMPAAVIGPWLGASFDNPLVDTCEPIGRLTLVGDPAAQIRTVTADGHGVVLSLAAGAGTQLWEVVSSLEWVADGDVALAWVFCFLRQFSLGDPVGAALCPDSVEAPLGEVFRLRVAPGEYRWVKLSGLATGDYRIRYSVSASPGGGAHFTGLPGACFAPGFVGVPPAAGDFVRAVTAPDPLRIVSFGVGSVCDVFVRVDPV